MIQAPKVRLGLKALQDLLGPLAPLDPQVHPVLQGEALRNNKNNHRGRLSWRPPLIYKSIALSCGRECPNFWRGLDLGQSAFLTVHLFTLILFEHRLKLL